MKKMLLALALVPALTIGVNAVNAEEMSKEIDQLDTNTYIVGYRIFEENKYRMSFYDVTAATEEFLKADGNSEKTTPLYYLATEGNDTVVYEITGPSKGGAVPRKN